MSVYISFCEVAISAIMLSLANVINKSRVTLSNSIQSSRAVVKCDAKSLISCIFNNSLVSILGANSSVFSLGY